MATPVTIVHSVYRRTGVSNTKQTYIYAFMHAHVHACAYKARTRTRTVEPRTTNSLWRSDGCGQSHMPALVRLQWGQASDGCGHWCGCNGVRRQLNNCLNWVVVPFLNSIEIIPSCLNWVEIIMSFLNWVEIIVLILNWVEDHRVTEGREVITLLRGVTSSRY